MNKIIAGSLAVLTAGSALAAAAPASAAPHHHRHSDAAGAAVVAGIAGLAIGAALAGDHHRSYYRPGYAYYGRPVYYGYVERCRTEWRWNPYWREYTRVRVCY